MAPMSAPAAKARSPPYRITARIASEPAAAARAADASSLVSWSFIALTGGRSSRIVPMPSATSSRTNSPIKQPLQEISAQVAVDQPGWRLREGDQAHLGPAVEQRVPGQDPDRIPERPRPVERDLTGVPLEAGGLGGALGRQGGVGGRGDLAVLIGPAVDDLGADVVRAKRT